MRVSRLSSHNEYYRQMRSDISEHVLPYKEIEEFVCDSSDVNDIGLTLVNFSEDEKNYFFKYYNEKGIVNTVKKKKAST